MEIKFPGLDRNFSEQLETPSLKEEYIEILLDKASSWFIVKAYQQPRSMPCMDAGDPVIRGAFLV
jgi:hypothetical protein